MENRKSPNKLSGEKSPYLLQHAHNPVDWYPWGEEALALAKKTNKPIFLSIGYSTCHWCHVMAHESFENTKTAELMNQHFINIKVDREERPDVDAIYMNAVQALSGSGGWPMSVWLTPDLKPFYGGTYYPPDERYGRPGFPSVLTQLAEVWEADRDKVLHSADQISDMLQQSVAPRPQPTQLPKAEAAWDTTFQSLQAGFDADNGGFGPAPKFPMPVYLDFLLEYHQRTKNQKALEMVTFSMKKMAEGGITDQLGGGFSRYSTDDRWTVPHFEKMLYDNAQLIAVAAELFGITQDEYWNRLTRDAIGYALRDLKHPAGAFYAAEDADSEGKEGTFYLWTVFEIKNHLDQISADIFIERYGVTANGNFFDPHTQETGKNVLVKAKSIEDVAKKFQKTPADVEVILAAAEKTLFDVRERRKRPHRDEKILTDWNGLMISALARASSRLREPRFLDAALKAAHFVSQNLYDAPHKRLYRRWKDGDRKVEGLQSDYAMLVQGLLDLHSASSDGHWLAWAAELQEIHDSKFFDKSAGGYFMSVVQDDLLIRMKDDRDGVIPSGNSIAAHNGLRLAALTGKKDFADKARRTLLAFAGQLTDQPVTVPKMTAALAVV